MVFEETVWSLDSWQRYRGCFSVQMVAPLKQEKALEASIFKLRATLPFP